MTSAARATAPAQRRPHPAGVWKFKGKILDRNAYYAVTSAERVVGNCLYLVSDDETDAELVWRLSRALKEIERPALQLLMPGEGEGIAASGPDDAAAELERTNSVIPLNDEIDPVQAATTLSTPAYVAYLTRRLYADARALAG